MESRRQKVAMIDSKTFPPTDGSSPSDSRIELHNTKDFFSAIILAHDVINVDFDFRRIFSVVFLTQTVDSHSRLDARPSVAMLMNRTEIQADRTLATVIVHWMRGSINEFMAGGYRLLSEDDGDASMLLNSALSLSADKSRAAELQVKKEAADPYRQQFRTLQIVHHIQHARRLGR